LLSGLLQAARANLQKVEALLLKFWGGLWGWIFHGDPGVYTYIAESLARFPDRRQLAMMFRSPASRFSHPTLFFCGIVQRITLRKSDPALPTPAKPEAII
jgi:ubiquinone/menaquinone biosynthesis C-methylase UbiE